MRNSLRNFERLEQRNLLAIDTLTVERSFDLVDEAWLQEQVQQRSQYDFNNDGLLDRFTIEQGGGFEIALKQPDGSEVATKYAPAEPWWSFAVGDIDGDGFLDVVASRTFPLPLQTFVNNGQGILDGFLESSDSPLPGVITVVDFDNDGHFDVIADPGSEDESWAELWNGDGTGEFQFFARIDTPGHVWETLTADLNRDGTTDFVFSHGGTFGHHFRCNRCPPGIAVALGRPDGTFSEARNIHMREDTSERTPFNMVIADVDGDGLEELSFHDTAAITLHLSERSGIFGTELLSFDPFSEAAVEPYLTYSWGPSGTWMSYDFDDDGFLDWFNMHATESGDTYASVHWGTREGLFENSAGLSMPFIISPLDSLHAVDLDRDGDRDIVVGDSSDLRTLEYLGDRQFSSESKQPFGSFHGRFVLPPIDLNGDSFVDVLQGNRGAIQANFGEGNGIWGPGTTLFETAYDFVLSIQTADMNNDGLEDIVVLGRQDGWVYVTTALKQAEGYALNRSVWNADFELPDFYDLNDWRGFTVADFDGDGNIDLSLGLEIMFGGPGGTLLPPVQLGGLPSRLQLFQSSDVNADGLPDLIYHDANNVFIAYAKADRSFQYGAIPNLALRTQASGQSDHAAKILSVDLNLDGIPDLVAEDANIGTRYFLGNQAGTFVDAPISYFLIGTPQASYDFDDDGDQDVILAGPHTLSVLLNETIHATPGDADADGDVDFTDFLVLSANFGAKNASWSQGDFDNDDVVGFSDFLILSANFGKKSGD